MTVGRVYFTDGGAYVAQAEYRAHWRLREPSVWFEGRVWTQGRQVPEGWVYQAVSGKAAPGGLTDEHLGNVVRPGAVGWVWPSDHPGRPVVDPLEAMKRL